MKKMMMVGVALVLAGCGYAKVPAGFVGVEVNQYGSSKGVDAEVLPVGRYWYNPWTHAIFKFPTFTQTYTWTKNPAEGNPLDESISFQTIEGLSVNADVGITYHVEADKAAILFQKYREGIGEITNTYIHNMVRDALVTTASKLPIQSVYGSGKAELVAAVESEVRAEVAPIGLVVERIYLVGNLRLPASVEESINSKIQATQQAQQRENQVATAKAEADIAVAKANGEAQSVLVNATAEAKANQMVSQSLTPELVQWQAIKTWNGALPQVAGGAVPFINLQASAKAPQ